MAKFVIKKIEFCEACKGQGMVQHPAWKEYWENNAEKSMTTEQDREWFYENGWFDDIYSNMDGIPSEEIPCVECEGEGTISSEVDLLEAVSVLHSALKTYGTW